MPGHLVLTVKFSELSQPLHVQDGLKIGIQTEEGIVTAILPPKIWRPLERAAQDDPHWVAAPSSALDRSVWPLRYPAGLTREELRTLGVGVLALDRRVYGVLRVRRRRRARPPRRRVRGRSARIVVEKRYPVARTAESGGAWGRMLAVQFWFDFASTYSYPAAWRVEALARRPGAPVEWKAFLHGPIFQAQGWNDSPFDLFPIQGRSMWRDLERICADLELPFRRPSQFPRPSVLAARVAGRFAAEPWRPDFVRAVFGANFAEDRDIARPVVLEHGLGALNLPGAELLEEAQSPAGKARLRARTEQAMAPGIFGAPTFVVGAELFWGNDRLEPALAGAAHHGGGRDVPGVQAHRFAAP